MAGVKITDLAELVETPADDDVIVIVDVSQNFTKKVSVGNLVSATPAPENVVSAQSINVETTGAFGSYYPTMVSISTGVDSVKTDTNVRYNASNGIFTAPSFEGNGGLLTNVLADSALRASTALFATDAANAVNATFATSADSADNATSSINSINAINATNAINADSATRSSTSLFANIAAFAQGVDSASRATTSLFATSADSAQRSAFALYAENAGFAIAAQIADSATNAGFAINAQNAVNAENAQYADSALFASNANLAVYAAAADSAINASNAVLAQFALESLSALKNIRDSDTGVRILGETTIDSDIYAKGNVLIDGIFYGDGSGLTNVTSTSVAEVAKQVDASILDSSALCYVMIRTSDTGYDSVNVTSALVYDPLTEIFLAPSFSGDGSNLTNITAVEANFAAAVDVTTVDDNSTYFVHLGSTTAGNDNVSVDVDLKYNPFLNKLTSGRFETGDWEVFEEGTSLFFSYNGIKKARLDTNGNLALVGTLTQNATL